MNDDDTTRRLADLEAEVARLRADLAAVVDGTNAALEDLRSRTLQAVRDTARMLGREVEGVRADRAGPLVLNVAAAPGPVRKRIETDEAGRIVAVVEEPGGA